MVPEPLKRDSNIVQMAESIRQYLNEHPSSADTLEGVVNWWLLRQRYEIATTMVSQALELLIHEGVLKTVSLQGSKTIYKLNKDNNR